MLFQDQFSYLWQILKEHVAMTPQVLSEIYWEEKNYYKMGSMTGKKKKKNQEQETIITE